MLAAFLAAVAFVQDLLPTSPDFYRELGLWGVFIVLVVPWLKRGAERLMNAQVALADKQIETLDRMAESADQTAKSVDAQRATLEGIRLEVGVWMRKLDLLLEHQETARGEPRR